MNSKNQTLDNDETNFDLKNIEIDNFTDNHYGNEED